jgi:hypothetical protein
MHKVLCEEPRGGQYFARRFPRPQIDCEDAPKYESIKKPHTARKWFGEHLGPLKRWLRSNVGRPWNDVYSEGSPIFKPDNVVRAHIRFHLLQMVERNTFMRDGVVWCHDYGIESEVRGGNTCWPVFYVHPESGLLLESHSIRRKEREARRAEEERLSEVRWLNDDVMLKRIDGIWYEFRFKKLRDGAGVFDLLERRVVFSHNVGHRGACVSKHQLSRRELKQYGLVNKPMIKARSSEHSGALTTALFAVGYLSTTIPGGHMAKHMTEDEQPKFEITSKRRKGFPSETQVKRGERIVHGNKELFEKLGRNDLCPCGSGQKFPELLPAFRQI